MAEKKFDAQVNYGWGLSLNMTGKYPAVAKRIFNTLADAQAYADNFNDSAIEGLVLSVVADDADKNGVYFVQSIKTSADTSADAVLVKLGSADAATSGASNALTEAKAYTDQEVNKLASGAVAKNATDIANEVTNRTKAITDEATARQSADNEITNKIGTVTDGKTVMGTIAEEVVNRQTAISDLKGALVKGDATTLKAINEELDAIDAKIGVVPDNKTVVGMIADAESAAKAAATKLNEKTSGHVTVSGVQDQTTSAWTYTISESDIASASGLTDEIDRATAAEASLQGQIGSGFTSANTVAAAIADAKDYASGYTDTKIASLNANVTSAEGAKVRVQVVETAGKITSVNITDVDIASAQALANEVTARKEADTNLQSQIGKAATETEDATGLHKEIADAKKALLGDAAEEYNTLGKLEDKIIAVSGAAKTYSIAKATKSEVASLGTNVKEAYKLIENGKNQVGEYIPVYKDSSLKEVKLVDQKLQFTYILDNGAESTVDVDVSKFLAESEFANGLQVIDHIVSVKRDVTSEDFLTVGEGGVKLSGVQDAIDTAKKAVTDRLDVIEGKETVGGSIKKALKDAKDYTDTEITALNADVTSDEGTKVRVQVVETAGKITAVTVTDVDIASATGLTAETKAREDADNALDGRLDVIEGSGEGSISRALADAKAYTNTKITEEVTARTNAIASAKTDLIGSATTEYNTLGKLEGKIKDAEAAAKAAATKLNKASDSSHLTLTSVTGTSGEITYTIGESDIASKTALDNEVTARTAADNTIKGRLDALEGVTVTGENAIVVDSTTANKKVSLKLGTQPAGKEAGVVLSQDANGLVAKLYWGAF